MTSSASTPPGVFVHPQALCESARVGSGTRIWAFAHVTDGAVVGCDCNLGDAVYVERGAIIGDRVTVKNGVMLWAGVTIEDEAFIGPAVVFSNDKYPRSPRLPLVRDRYQDPVNWLLPTLVSRGASLGAGAVILPGVTIGPFAMVAAGSVITHDVPAHRLVVGNPARVVGWVCACGGKLSAGGTCCLCNKNHEFDGDQLRTVHES